jgi:rfaE bifunctional protein kinase chain/domain
VTAAIQPTPSGPNERLVELLQRFQGATVAVVGDLVADEYVVGETDRVSREAPVLVVRYEHSEIKAGCAANATANLCALGARVRPVGLVGDDAVGLRLRGLLAESGADVTGILEARGSATATKMRILAGGKNTRRQQIVRLDRDGPGVPSGALRARLVAALANAVRGADALLVSDYGIGLLAALRPAVLRLGEALPICVDSRYDLRSYRGVALAKPNEVELEHAVGRRLASSSAAPDAPGTEGIPADLETAGRMLLSQLRAQSLLVTRGRHGMVLFRPNRAAALLPPHGSREAVDVTGAGDTVMAATTLGLACGASPIEAARLGNVAGGLVVQKPGTATVTADEIRVELRAREVHADEEPAAPRSKRGTGTARRGGRRP